MMWRNVIENFILGFVISAVPGAVFIETIRRLLVDKTSVWKFLLGNFIGMLLIIVSVFLGFAVLVTQGSIANVFYGVSGLVLIFLGLSSIVSGPRNETKKLHLKNKTSSYIAFTSGLLLAVANPLSIVFWIALIGVWMQTANIMEAGIYSVSVLAGALTLFIILIVVINTPQARVSVKYLTLLSRVFGMVILIYGIVMLSKAFL